MATREDWMRRLGPLYGGAVALVGSTPWRWPEAVANAETRSPFWVVAVGAPIGLLAWLVAAALRTIHGPVPLAAIFALATLTFASAAIVERGTVERIETLSGGRTGSPGVISILVLVFSLLLRAATILVLPPARWLGLLVAAPLVGRWAAVFLQSLGDPILDDAEARSLVCTPAPPWLTAALSLAVAIASVLLLGKIAIVVLAFSAVVAFGLGVHSQSRDRGLTGPVVATAAAIAELAVFVLAAT